MQVECSFSRLDDELDFDRVEQAHILILIMNRSLLILNHFEQIAILNIIFSCIECLFMWNYNKKMNWRFNLCKSASITGKKCIIILKVSKSKIYKYLLDKLDFLLIDF